MISWMKRKKKKTITTILLQPLLSLEKNNYRKIVNERLLPQKFVFYVGVFIWHVENSDFSLNTVRFTITINLRTRDEVVSTTMRRCEVLFISRTKIALFRTHKPPG